MGRRLVHDRRETPREARNPFGEFSVVAGLLVLLLAGCIPLERPPVETAPTAAARRLLTDDRSVPDFSHVFVIVMENREYGEVIGSPDAPYTNRLANTYALATRYYAIRHPSLPNYLALISGSTQGKTTDCETCTIDAPNLVDQLTVRQKTWTAYMDDLPGPCFNGTRAGGPLSLIGRAGYVRRHDPFMYFDDIRENPDRCRRVVPLSRFADDLGRNQLPAFVWITPGLSHDMHSSSTRDGDNWLASFVPAILQSSAWRNGGVLFITWDEGTTDAGCCGTAGGGHVPTLVIAANGKPGYRSSLLYTHYSLLRTIEDAWRLGYLGHAGDPATNAMAEFFQ